MLCRQAARLRAANHGCSEKARIPAWTDRILRKGTNLRQLAYNSAPLRFSDHRPVYAIFECTVTSVDERVRDEISRKIYERRKAEVGGGTANLAAGESDDEDLIGYDAIEPGLPPASSDRQKWWLENGKMARSSISPPKPDSSAHQTILNPNRATNPYVPSDEPDWVSVPRSESRLSSFSSMSTSPYEHVNCSALLSSSASSSGPRKLPPPFDPSSLPVKVGRLQISEETRSTQADGPPPPPPPRRQTSMGPGPATSALATMASIKRKPVDKGTAAPAVGPKPTESQKQPAKQKSPPPVAKKPAHLAAPASPAASASTLLDLGSGATTPHASETSLADATRHSTPVASGSSPSKSQLDGSFPPLLPMNSKCAREKSPPSPPQLPRRTDTSTSLPAQARIAAAGGIPLVGLAGLPDRKPLLPARKPTAPIPTAQKQAPPRPLPRSATVDLLGDESSVELGGWEALKPS